MTLLEMLTRPLPNWIVRGRDEAETRRNEVKRIVHKSELMIGCAKGKEEYIRAFILGAWEFVDKFPWMIEATIQRTAENKIFQDAEIQNAVRTIRGIKNDESGHRQLWINTAKSLGISSRELYAFPPSQEVLFLNTYIGGETDLYKTLLRFVAVEMVAEEVSKFLLNSAPFKAVIGNRGIEWFRVHATHKVNEITHEEISCRVAFAIYGDGFPAEDEVWREIIETVKYFDEVAKRCVKDLRVFHEIQGKRGD